MDEKNLYWTVGEYCNAPETLEHARARAEREAANTGKKTYLYKLVGAVSARNIAEWESVESPSKQPASAPQIDAFKVGEFSLFDRAEAIRNAVDGQSTIRDGEWMPCTVTEVRPFEKIKYMVKFDSGEEFCMYDYQVRRPAPSQPAQFEFGQAVRVNKFLETVQGLPEIMSGIVTDTTDKSVRVAFRELENQYWFMNEQIL